MERKCSKCKIDFVPTGTDTYCKPCRAEYGRKWTENNKERHNARNERNRQKYKTFGPVTTLTERTCGECDTRYPLTKDYWNVDRSRSTGFNSVCIECSKSNQNNWNDSNRELKRAYTKKSKDSARVAALKHYGGDSPCCKCCGETTLVFLCIDHIEGKGNSHRREVGEGGSFTAWLRRNGFPEGFQILCWNCNSAKSILGQCPHSLTSTQPQA